MIKSLINALTKPLIAGLYGAAGAVVDATTVLFKWVGQTSIVAEVGDNPAFIRATTATVMDYEGVMHTAAAGEPRFQGARRVHNLITENTEDFTGWTIFGTAPTTSTVVDTVDVPAGKATSSTTLVNNANYQGFQIAGLMTVGHTYVATVYAKTSGFSTSIWMNDNGASKGIISITGDGEWHRYQETFTVTSNVNFAFGTYTSPRTVQFAGIQLEDVTASTSQIPSEYVSYGVLTTPFHGATVDGLKNFSNLNGTLLNGLSKVSDPAPTLTGIDLGIGFTGVTGEGIQIPSADWTATEFDMRVRAVYDTSKGAIQLISKYQDSVNATFYFQVRTDTRMYVYAKTATNATRSLVNNVYQSSFLTQGDIHWFRVTKDSSDVMRFYLADGALDAPSGADWVQQGSDLASNLPDMRDNAHPITVGNWKNFNSPYNGMVRNAQIFTTVDGTTPDYEFDANNWVSGTTVPNTATLGGAEWTLNGTVSIVPGDGSPAPGLPMTTANTTTSFNLADTYGPEVSPNSTFDTDIVGWTAPIGGGTLSWVAGTAEFLQNSNTTTSYIVARIPTTYGQTYRLTIEGSEIDAGWTTSDVRLGTSVYNSQTMSNTHFVFGTVNVFEFTATDSNTTEFTMFVRHSTIAAARCSFTEISCKLVTDGAAVTQQPPVDDKGPFGYLTERAATNLVPSSEDHSSAGGWALSGITVTAAANVSPTGATTMDRLVVDTTTGTHSTYNLYYAPVADRDYAFSIYMKDAGAGFGGFVVGSGSNSLRVVADLSTGLVTYTSASGGIIKASGCDDVGNGVYRVWLSGRIPIQLTTYTIFACDVAVPTVFNSSGVPSYTGVLGQDLFVWGSQYEIGTYPTSYIPTAGSATTRNADVINTSVVVNDPAGAFYAQTSSIWDVQPGASRTLLTRGNTSVQGRVLGSNSTFIKAFSNGSGLTSSPAGTSYQNAPQDLATTWGDSGLIAYFNGAPDATPASYGGTFGIGDLYIGHGWNGQYNWDGTIRNVEIHNVELTEAEIGDL